jgi:superfamily II DNA helicase RecQ
MFVAPERLFQPEFLQWLDARIRRVRHDEAHCISQWGTISGPVRLAELRERFRSCRSTRNGDGDAARAAGILAEVALA